MNKFAIVRRSAAAAGLAALAVSQAHADAPDVSGVVSEITGAAVPIGLIGSAVLIVMVGIKVFKWVRRAM